MDRTTTEARRRRKLNRILGRLKPRTAPKLKARKSERFTRTKLTAKRIEKLLTRVGRFGDEHVGLYLQVRSPTNCSWLYRYQRDKREHFLGLGPLKAVSRDEAVEKAKEADRLLRGYSFTDANGVTVVVKPTDPLEARRAAKSAEARTTFKQVAEAWLASRSDTWKNQKYRDQAYSIFRDYCYGLIGSKPVADIDLKDILKVMEQRVPAERGLPGGPFYKARPETAERCRRRMESVITRAIVSGDRLNRVNPAAWQGNLKELIPRPKVAEKHHASLAFRDVPAFVTELRTREGIAPRALEFAILCASRTGEVTGALWPEIDFETALWTIPGERMKAGVEHVVPLSARAVEILKALPREDGNNHVFLGGKRGRGLSNMALLTLIKAKMGYSGVTTHGMRSSFKNWSMEVAHFADEVSEAALAHQVGSAVRRAYATGNMLVKRRKLMEAWAAFVGKPVAASTDNNVTQLRRRAK